MNEEGCAFCKNDKPLITWENGEAYIVEINELPAINLNTGEETPPKEKMYHALEFTCTECERKDYARINYCPMCGRKLKED